MNKIAALGEQASIFMFLFLLIVVGIGITAGAYIFFGRGYDFRMSDASLLNGKIRECLNDNEINDELLNNLFARCKLNEKVLEDINIIKICVDSSDCVNGMGKFAFGSNFQSCFFEGAKDNKKYYSCDREHFLKDGKKIEIIAGSKRTSRETLG